MFIGTCAAPQPLVGFNTPLLIDIARADSTGWYQGYMEEDAFISSTFSGVPSGNNCWRWAPDDYNYRYLCGADLNAPTGGDPSDPYVIIEICEEEITTPEYTSPTVFVDDISIAIY
jgi:hypothetical protein